MRTLRTTRERDSRSGGALVGVCFLVAVLATLSYSTLALSAAAAREHKSAQGETSAHYLSSAGLSEAVYALRHGGTGKVGSADQPIEFAGGSYFVRRTDDGTGPCSIVSTAQVGGATVRTQLVLRVRDDGIFRWGAFGEEELLIDQDASVDSYDSSNGTYAEQAVNGINGHAYARTRGNVGSNGDILLRQNSRVYGDALPGPTRTTTVTGNATLSGASTPSATKLELPPFSIPAGIQMGPLHVDGGNTVSIPAGSRVFGDMNMDARSRVVVHGPSKLVFESFVIGSSAEFLVDATGGPVEIYVKRDFIMSSNAWVGAHDRDPRNVAFFLTSDNIIDPDQQVDLDQIDLESNSKLFGTIYAPSALIDVNSNFALYGSVVAKRLILRSFSQIHYDENLAHMDDDRERSFEIIGWRVMPDHPHRAQTDNRTTADGTDGPLPSEGSF